MRRLTYKNPRGEKIVFHLSPLLIESLEGIAEVDADIQGQRLPHFDGDLYLGSTLEPRYIDLGGCITRTDFIEIRRQRTNVLKVCNPKLGPGEVTLELDGRIKKIRGVLDGVPSFPERGRSKFQRFMVSWKCPNPYWQDVSESKEEIALWRGAFHFPLAIPQNNPIIMGYREPSLIVNVINRGNVKTGMRIEFKALGTLESPSLFNVNTREFIKINKSMVAGEKIIINTNQGSKKITSNLNGVTTDILDYIDIIGGGRTFLQLDPGDNLLRYDAVDGISNLEVNIYYNNNYLGV